MVRKHQVKSPFVKLKRTLASKVLQNQATKLLASTPLSDKNQAPLFESTITPFAQRQASTSAAGGNVARDADNPDLHSKSPPSLAKKIRSAKNRKTKSFTSGSQSKGYSNKQAEDGEKSLRKKRRFRPGTRVLMEIRHYQKRTDLLIPRLPFSRLIKEIFQGMGASNYRIQALALEALQEAAEAYLIFSLEMANLCAIHAKRVTLYPQDLKLAQRIRGDKD